MGLVRVNRVRIFCDGKMCNEDVESPTVAQAVLLGWVKVDENVGPDYSSWLCPDCAAKRKGEG